VAHGTAGRQRAAAVAGVVGASVLFGTTGTALQKGPAGATALGAGAARLAVGAATLGALAHLSRPVARRDWRAHRRSSVFGGLMVVVYQLSFFEATRRAGVAVATVCTIASGPIFAALIQWGRIRCRSRPFAPSRELRGDGGRSVLGRPWWIGTLACIAGVVLIVTPRADGALDVDGVAAAFLSGLGYAAYATAAKHQMERGLDPAGSMAALFGVSAVLSAPLMLVEPMRWVTTGRGVALIAHLGVVTVGVAYTLYGRGLRRLPTPTVVTLTLVEPITAALLSVVVLREPLHPVSWFGILVVLGGLVVATQQRAR
jgi:DME family drug/metabolite transporter